MHRYRTAVRHTPLRLLFAVVAALSIVVFGFFAVYSWQQERRDAELELRHIGQMLLQSTRAMFHQQESLLRMLGERLREVGALTEPERGRMLVERMTRINKGMAGFGLARGDGQLIVVSGIPADKALPNLALDRVSADSFRRALDHEGLVPGRTYFMQQLNQWVIPIRVAIRDKQNRVPLIMTAGLTVDGGETTWNTLDLPFGVDIRVIRDDGYVQFMNPLPEDRRGAVYERRLEPETLAAIESASAAGNELLRGAGIPGNVPRTVVLHHLPQLGLYLLVTRPQSDIIQRWLSTGLTNLEFLVLALSGFYLVYRYTRRMQEHAQEQLIHQAHHDPLTNLPNRLLVRDRIKVATKLRLRAKRQIAVLFIDLDHFKKVNDSLGHSGGDALLREVADRLSGAVRVGDTVSRQGGDEFIVLLSGEEDPTRCGLVAQRILEALRPPVRLGGREVFISASIGIALAPRDGEQADELLRRADAAMYQAKEAGRNTYRFFTPEMNQQSERRFSVEANLRRALERGELSLEYQPQVEVATGHMVGVEALLRWTGQRLGPVMPAEFVPVAEEINLIQPIGRFVLRQACADVADLRRAGHPDLMCFGESFNPAIDRR